MKIELKPVLGISVLLAALVAAPLVYSKGQHTMGMDGMPGLDKGRMMGMDIVQNRMPSMSKQMDQTDNSKDMSKHQELMQKHMVEMQAMMGNQMSGSLSMEKRQPMIDTRMDVMKQQSMMMKMEK